MILTFRPIDRWDRPQAPRSSSPFSASYNATLSLLDRELHFLRAQHPVLMVDASEADFRIDGQLRANATLASPRVILAFDSMHGPLKYACDAFWKWQDNLRAIALGLEALRRVERYGIASRGEQYTGWKALGAGIALGPATMSVEQALAFIGLHAAVESVDARDIDLAYRLAAKRLHPDNGGDEDQFKRLVEAKRILDESGTF